MGPAEESSFHVRVMLESCVDGAVGAAILMILEMGT